MNKNAVMPLSDYISACDKIREKTETTGTIVSGEWANKVDEVYDAGVEAGKAQGEASADDYLTYSVIAGFPNLNLFGKSEVVINMPYLKNAQNMFRPNTSVFGNDALNRTVEHLTLISTSQNITNTQMMFYFSEPWDAQTALKHITLNFDMSKVAFVNQMFAGLVNLETVDGTPLDCSSSQEATIRIGGGSKFAHIRFAPNTIKQNLNASDSSAYTEESVQSMIDGLITITDGVARTLSLHATVKGKLTDEQKATITITKGWTLA